MISKQRLSSRTSLQEAAHGSEPAKRPSAGRSLCGPSLDKPAAQEQRALASPHYAHHRRGLAVGESSDILLLHPLPLVGASIGMERGRQQN